MARVLTNTQCIDVLSVRRARGLTQQAFAQTFGFTVGGCSRLGAGKEAARSRGANSSFGHSIGPRCCGRGSHSDRRQQRMTFV